MKRTQDRKHPPATYDIGEKVWYNNGIRQGKFAPVYEGPYTIIDSDKQTYTISRNPQNRTESRTATARQLKRFHDQPTINPAGQDAADDDAEATVQSSTSDDNKDRVTMDEPNVTLAETASNFPTTSSQRQRRRPAWLKDFVTDCEDAVF